VTTTWCVPLPSPYHFFRVVPGSSGTEQARISRVVRETSGVRLDWTAAPGLQFYVQWTDQLEPPNWIRFTTVVTSTTSAYTFLDDGTEAGGLEAPRFYRLEQVQ
jgi:hypothetical protein